jgi:hypothetical protein
MPRLRFAIVVLVAAMSLSTAASQEPKGLGDPGPLETLRIDTGRAVQGVLHIHGRDSWQQLQVTGLYKSGQERDLTRAVKFTTAPAGIVAIDAAGLATPLKEGETTLTVKQGALTATLPIAVGHLVDDVPVHFGKQIVPLFTKYGCNAGGCHGKASGQNGFKLSLLGFEPDEDFEYITRENRGRRLFPAAAERSLLLLKATGGMPHGGAKKFDVDSPPYRVIRRWIEQGSQFGKPTDPSVTRIEVLPVERLLERKSQQQLTVVAHLSDGSTVDVTRMAQFESNEKGLADVDANGLVATKNVPGVFAVMTRYQTHVATFRGLIPLGAPIAKMPPAKNFVDELVFRHLKRMGLPASELADDSTFLRRATLDIAGRLPTLEETKDFLADTAADRHDRLVDRLLATPDYADLFAVKWSAVLRNRRAVKDDAKPTIAFHAWIREALEKNIPFDQFVRQVVAARGDLPDAPPVAWYREAKDISTQVEDVAQLFLGQRIGCAKCHHHPFEKWTTDDYWAMAAFFSRVDIKAAKPEKKDNKTKMVTEAAQPMKVLMKAGKAESTNPKTKKTIKAAGLDAPEATLKVDDDPRDKLVDWIAEPANPFFAKTLANRYWKHFMGRALVEPEDDIRATNPATNPELLEALAKHFAASKFDVKKLIRAICTSNTYRLSSTANAYNADDKQNYSRFLYRRLPAEVLHDAIDAVTLTKPAFKGAPAGTRALQLPDNQGESYFLSVFGRPDFVSACECERSGDTTLAQSLHMYNSVEVGKKVAGERAKKFAADKKLSVDDRLREIYLVAFSRPPSDEEMSHMRTYIEARSANLAGAIEDILWAVLNTKEFAFNH